MFTFTKCYLGLVNQKENYRRLQNVGAKTGKKKYLTQIKVFGLQRNIKPHSK